jgi:hypothetical protein
MTGREFMSQGEEEGEEGVSEPAGNVRSPEHRSISGELPLQDLA